MLLREENDAWLHENHSYCAWFSSAERYPSSSVVNVPRTIELVAKECNHFWTCMFVWSRKEIGIAVSHCRGQCFAWSCRRIATTNYRHNVMKFVEQLEAFSRSKVSPHNDSISCQQRTTDSIRVHLLITGGGNHWAAKHINCLHCNKTKQIIRGKYACCHWELNYDPYRRTRYVPYG